MDSGGSSTAVLCPMEERRLPRELYVYFIIIHFTIVGAYAHLRHLRWEGHILFIYFHHHMSSRRYFTHSFATHGAPVADGDLSW